jgi:hypothetical protein
LKSAVDRLEERIENMTVIQAQGKSFIIRGGGNWGGRPGDIELMGREQLCTTSEDTVSEPEMKNIYSVIYLERVHGVTNILIHTHFKL